MGLLYLFFYSSPTSAHHYNARFQFHYDYYVSLNIVCHSACSLTVVTSGSLGTAIRNFVLGYITNILTNFLPKYYLNRNNYKCGDNEKL
jgi:hypothetical protein